MTNGSENFCRVRPNGDGSRTAFRFRLIEVPVIHRLDYAEQTSLQINTPPAKRKQLSYTQSRQHEQRRDRACGFIQRRSNVSHLDRSEDYSLRSVLSSREFRFLSDVVGYVAPFFGCSENLAHTTLEVVNGFPRQPVAEFSAEEALQLFSREFTKLSLAKSWIEMHVEHVPIVLLSCVFQQLASPQASNRS